LGVSEESARAKIRRLGLVVDDRQKVFDLELKVASLKEKK
jgi:hypothetical protein